MLSVIREGDFGRGVRSEEYRYEPIDEVSEYGVTGSGLSSARDLSTDSGLGTGRERSGRNELVSGRERVGGSGLSSGRDLSTGSGLGTGRERSSGSELSSDSEQERYEIIESSYYETGYGIYPVSDLRDEDYYDGQSLFAVLADADLILADSRCSFLKEHIPEFLTSRIVVLTSEAETDRSVDEKGIRYVFKYDSAPSLISSIAELADSFGVQKLRRRTGGKLKVIAVTGFHGGAGRTSFAFVFAKLNQSMKKKNTLVFSVDRFSDLCDYFANRPAGVSDVNLLLLNFLSGFKIAPSRFLVQDSSGVCTFAYPAATPSDMSDLSRDDLTAFVKLIEEWDMFDTLVVDLGGAEDEIHRTVLGFSDMVCVMHDDRRGGSRVERLWMERVTRICNVNNIVHIYNCCVRGDRAAASQGDRESLRFQSGYEIPEDRGSFICSESGIEVNMTGRFADAVSAVLRESEMIV